MDAEQTCPPGIASSSTPKFGESRTSAESVSGTTGRSFTTESSSAPCAAARPDNHAGPIEREVGSLEEVDLPDLRRDGIQAECRHGRSLLAVGDGQLELDGVGARRQGEDGGDLLIG